MRNPVTSFVRAFRGFPLRAAVAGLVLGILAGPLVRDSMPPRLESAQASRLIDLFGALQAVSDPKAGAILEEAIWDVWTQTRSPTVRILMDQAEGAQENGDPGLALRSYDAAVAADPEYFPAYDRRAALRYARGDVAGALRDIEACLRLEPRHFGAWVGLGAVFEEWEAWPQAQDAYRRALRLNPFLEPAREGLARMRRRAEGRIA